MSYATPTELRARYLQGTVDEFAARADTELARALQAASSEIDSYRPAADLTAAALQVLKDKCMTLARMFAHQDAALDESHPIVRDAQRVLDWLLNLSRGVVHLPAGDGTTSGGTGAAWDCTPTVWGRGTGGGL